MLFIGARIENGLATSRSHQRGGGGEERRLPEQQWRSRDNRLDGASLQAGLRLVDVAREAAPTQPLAAVRMRSRELGCELHDERLDLVVDLVAPRVAGPTLQLYVSMRASRRRKSRAAVAGDRKAPARAWR